LNKTSLFAIELGDKDHFASRVREMSKEVKNGKAKLVAGNIIRMGDGRKLSEKFYEHFKRPTTPPALVPEIIDIKPAGYQGYDWGKIYHDKDCQIRHTDKTTYPLGNITDGELLVNFTLWTSSKGKNGTIEVFHGTESIIQLYANATMITHTFKFSEAYTHVVDTGHTFDLSTIYNENVTFRFYCKYKGNTAEILFLSNRKPILEWDDPGAQIQPYNGSTPVEVASKFSSDWARASGERRKTKIPFIINKETKVFELNIIANKTSDTMTKYEFEINGVKYLDSTIITAVPPWKIDQIKVTGNIQNVKFLESTSKKCLKVKEYKLPSNMAKTDKRLVQGDQIIIKGQVPNPFNETTITVCLMHRALEVTEHIGENIYILYIYSNYSDNTAFVGGDWSHKDQYNKDTASNSVNLNGGERIRISINFQSDDKIKPIVETEEHTIQDTIEYSCSSEYSYDLIEYIQVHSGLVLWQQQKPTTTSFGSIVGRERIARLLLTKDQLNVQLPVSDESAKEFADAQQHQGIGRSPAAKLSIVDLNSEQQVTLRTVNVPKGPEGLGLSIKGGSEGTHRVPIVISKVLPGLSAAKTNQVFVGDLIVEVNGMSLEGKTHEEVVQLLKDSTGPHVTLTLKRDSSASPLLRNTSETSPVSDHVTVFKSALKTPMLYQQSPKLEEKTIIIEEPQNNLVFESEDDVVGNGGEKWKTICKIPLPLAFVSRYLWATDKLRSNAFEVRSVDGRSSGIIHCEDRKVLEQWVQHIDSHINALNRKTIRMSNKYLHASDRVILDLK
uniref:PDZ domain-containing protein n=1 Tax=Meloidogyne floridensis TaxID=298350 RepID=A0A915P2N8_9BILA